MREVGERDEEGPPSTQELCKLQTLIDKACAEIGEYADCVQIFAAVKSPHTEGTSYVHNGKGNYFARVGQVVLWLDRERTLHKKHG